MTKVQRLASERLGVWLGERVVMGTFKSYQSAMHLVEHEPATLDFALILAKREALARKVPVEVRRGSRVLAYVDSAGMTKLA